MPALIVLDLEWNSASRGLKVDPDLAARMMFEIIEIGAVRLDEDLRITGRFQRQVKPVLYTKIQRYIARVTQRTQQSLDEGVSFSDAFRDLMAFAGPDPVLASWGTSDPEVLISNLRFHHMEEIPFKALNIQAAFSAFAEGTRRGNQRSIEYALDYLRLDKELPFHEALSDAIYAAKILEETLMADPEDPSGGSDKKASTHALKGFIYDPFLVSQSESRLEYGKRDQPLAVLGHQTYRCPACSQALEANWREINPGKSWFAAGHCPKHGDIELTAKRARRSKLPSLMIRTRIPQGPMVIPQSPPPKEEVLVWEDPQKKN